MIELQITGVAEVGLFFESLGERIHANIGILMEQSLQVAEAAVKRNTPIGPTSETINSITHESEFSGDSAEGYVYSNADDQAAIATIEEGRSAGSPMPPLGAIEEWLAFVGGEPDKAYIVARAIADNGSPGHFMFQKGFDEAHDQIISLWDDILG